MLEIDKFKNTTVYCHVNKINGKIYIGITTQDKMWKRWGSNGVGYKPSKKQYTNRFWNAIQKYGWDNFEHIILINNIPLWQAELIEKELIKKYKTREHKYGYNTASGGFNGGGVGKKINQYTLEGSFVNTWLSAEEAGRAVNRCANDITACCSKKRKTLANYLWRYYDDVNNTEPIESYKPSIKSVLQYDLNGIFLKQWESTREIYKVLGFQIDTIQAACSGVHDSACGFQWRYLDDIHTPNKNISKYIYTLNKRVNQYDMDWNYIQTWDSLSNAERSLNIASGSITHCCKGKYKHAGGYRWQYAN